ncbi:TWiK family of potassium channels protein 18-like isoform X2 [Cimex lectularius]|uniref:PHD-type domain-containing protein n=1 Tax=Cimex lectularius TaxID=79782 RepID=A0A8I6RA96_CIMLE|nr:TWiK family of potassium channels protein 18-like isoform X2 [Cimex lectularius]
MLSFKGSCSVCKQTLTVFAPGFVCYDCEKFFHGNCLTPPLTIEEMNAVVVKTRQWLCAPCKAIRGKEFVEVLRPDKEAREIKKKIEAINEIRDLLTRIEEVLDDTTNQCEKLTEQAKTLQRKNLDLRMRMLTYTKGQRMTVFRINPDDKIARERWLFTHKKLNKAVDPNEKSDLITAHENILKEIKKETFKNKLKTSEKLMLYLQESLSSVSKGGFIQLVLIILITLYTLLGAFVFMLVEGIYEKQLLHEIFDRRMAIIEKMAQNHKNGGGAAASSQTELESYYDFLWEYYNINNKLLQPGDVPNWNYLGSVFFCGITYTTIGFGYFVPVTVIGKIITVLYILFGIPLFLILMATLGTAMYNMLRLQWKWFKTVLNCKCCGKKDKKSIDSVEEDVHDVPILLVILVEMVYLIIGGIIFTFIEAWTFTESLYFVFISMTVGFGDYIPSKIGYMMALFAYIVLGLALTSMFKIVSSFEKATHKLGTSIERYLHDQYMKEAMGDDTK